jgi:hypothetical protein
LGDHCAATALVRSKPEGELTPSAPYASLATIGQAVGPAIGRHLDPAFRRIAPGNDVANEPTFLRLVSGEPHPLGNFAVLSAPATLASARAVVEPLVAVSVPSAVLFPALEVPPDVAAYLAERGSAGHGSRHRRAEEDLDAGGL